MRRRLEAIATVTLLLAALGLSACNTTEGMGKDMSAAGHAISNKADEAK